MLLHQEVKILQSKEELIEVLIENNFDVVHIHLASASYIEPLVQASKYGVKKVIAHSHNSMVEGGIKSKILHILNINKLNSVCTHRLACSNIAGIFMYGNRSEFKAIKNAINAEKFYFKEGRIEIREKIRESLSIQDKIVLGNIARFVNQKNQIFLVDLIEEMSKINEKSHILLVGDGPEIDKVKKYAKEKNIEKYMTFVGSVNNANEYCFAMDGFILPSLFEGLPLTAIESQASGLTTFLADTITEETKITDLVEFFSLEDDKHKLASKIIDTISNIERIDMSKYIKDAGYDLSENNKEIEDIYTEE